jgi:GMP synthase (glutamine-hydrolysing)
MMQHQTILIPDFGGQYSLLIARRVREMNVFCEVCQPSQAMMRAKEIQPIGIILTGGPRSVFGEDAFRVPKELFELGIPTLGICYGAELMAYTLGGQVETAEKGEYGGVITQMSVASPLFDFSEQSIVTWMNHRDYIAAVPPGFVITSTTENCPVASMEDPDRKLYSVQFHPEVVHTNHGESILHAFLYKVCEADGDWKMDEDHVAALIRQLQTEIGDNRVVLALSGGVDSSVLAALLDRAIGDKLTCVFVDHGLMRKGEGDAVEKLFEGRKLQFHRVNCAQRFLDRLEGVSNPEQKRKIIGEEFIRVFESETKQLGFKAMLSQGTIYPDVVESGRGDADVIKSHHNVGGLPKNMDFIGLVEPLRDLFKDEVRVLGTKLGLPDSAVWRQPFPGPGLAVRILGEITQEKLEILREADAIFTSELEKAGLQRSVHQYFAVLTNLRTVGIMGDARTYNYTVALRGVTTVDFMTADFAHIPLDLLGTISSRITNEVPMVGRIVYDITSKPPGTIEWE